MNKLYSFLLLCPLMLGSLALSAGTARAQDTAATVAWQVTRFDITASPALADRSLNVRAVLKARNVGRGSGQTITLRLNNKSEVKAASINDAVATFRSSPESRGNLLRVQINLPTPIAPDGVMTAALDY